MRPFSNKILSLYCSSSSPRSSPLISTFSASTCGWLMESAPPKSTEPPHQHDPSSSSSSSSLALSQEGLVSNNNMHETRSSPIAGNSTPGLIGKHRMSAAISFLNQQIQSIQEELDQLETLGRSSTVCEELISSVESVPDALLPETRGPAEVSWERWFQGAHSSGNRRRRWI